MITKKKIRKVFSPLTVTVKTETTGSASQVYESMYGTWKPSRTAEPFVVTPHVLVTTEASDTTWENGDYISAATVQWYANGVMIQDSPLNSYYTVGNGVENGKLTITKNCIPGEEYDLYMLGQFRDNRNNQLIQFQTDPIHMGVSEFTADEWDLSVVHDVNVKYHPLLDLLKEYDWKVANGIIEASDAERNKCMDGNQYALNLPIIISRGSAVVKSDDFEWDDVQLKVLVRNSDGDFGLYGPSEDPNQLSFVTSLSKENIGIDLRLVPGGTVMEVALYVRGVKMASEFVTFSYVVDNYTCEPTNEGDLDPNATYRYDRALCYVCGRKLEYPEAYLQIGWYTNTSNAIRVLHGTGSEVSINIANARVGTADDCWIEVFTDSKVKTLVAVITIDEDGKAILTDGTNAITADMLSY